MPVSFIDITDDYSDFTATILPLSNKFAAMFADGQGAESYGRLSMEETVRFNSNALDGNGIWTTVLGRADGPVRAAVNRCKELEHL